MTQLIQQQIETQLTQQQIPLHFCWVYAKYERLHHEIHQSLCFLQSKIHSTNRFMTFDHGNTKSSVHCLYSNLVKIIKRLIDSVDDSEPQQMLMNFFHGMSKKMMPSSDCFSFVCGFVQHKFDTNKNEKKHASTK